LLSCRPIQQVGPGQSAIGHADLHPGVLQRLPRAGWDRGLGYSRSRGPVPPGVAVENAAEPLRLRRAGRERGHGGLGVAICTYREDTPVYVVFSGERVQAMTTAVS
jgi:hypothetical protein